MFGRRRGRERTAQQVSGQGPADQRGPSVRKPKSKRGTGGRAGDEQSIPSYTPSITARSIDGHLLRTNQDVFAWYRLSPQRWSFRSDAQRQDLIAAIAGQYAELQGRWLHLRVTTRPYPIRMWAEAHVRNARNALQDVPGALSFDDYMVGEQQQLMGRSMAEKEVYLGVQVQTRNVVDRAVERAAPLLRKVFPEAVDAELVALDSEVEHLDQVIGSAGLDGRPVTAEEVSWLMHRSCSLGLPAPRNLPAVPGAPWEPEDLASFTDAADMHQDPYAPTVTVRGRTGSNAGVSRNVAVLTMGQGHGLQIPEVDDPWMQRSDRLSAPVEWSARIYVRRPEDVSGELQRQMNKVRSQVRHYTEEHGLEPPTSLARQASRVLEIDDEMTSGFTALATRVKSWWRMAVSGPTERDALRLAQQLLDLYKPKIAIEHPEAQYAMAREFIPGEPLANGAYLRRGSVVWAGSAVPQATAEVGDRRGVLLGETCTATRRPVAWDPWMAQEVRDASGLTAMVAGLGGGKALALDTPLPTPTGWTTMSEVAVGDHVLGGDGAPTRVVAATDILSERPCYDVVFSDGSVIRADAQHQWVTRSNTATASRVVDGSPHPMQQPVVRTTSEIAARIASGQQFQHPVPTAAPFDLPETDLSVEPYLLGAWLGDAMSRRASIASSDPELIQEIEATGQECTYHPARGEHELPTTVRQNLCHLGLLDNKHVPVDYLRAGEQQRRALLAGLLDAAGGCDPSGRVELFASGERLARDVRELVLGLGYPAQLHAQRSDQTHSDASPVHTVSFTTPDKVFRLARKLALLDPSAPVEERHITAVVPVDSVPVRCVEVANAEHTYLAGPTCVPTHNSFLGGGTVYKTLRAGAHWTLLDPSGPLAELCELPELKPYARPINLLNAQPGILNPYRVVAEPELEHFVDEEDPERGWRRERALAAATRRRLVLDVLTGLLPYEVARLPQTRIVLLRAVRAVGGRPDAHPGMVFEALRRDASEHHEHAIVVADFLDEIRERMSLLIPESDADPYSEGRDDRLTVLTMAGLTLPKDGVGREHWTDAEALGVQMLNLAAWLTQRTLYERPKNERKGVWIDEAFFLSEVPTGRVLMNRFARDSRKWNVRVLLSSQIPADFLRIQGFAALLDSVFIGRLDDEQAQADALRLLKVPVDAGYEQVVSALGRRPGPARNNTERDRSPRQFIFGDGDGGVEKIRIDFSGDHLEHLRTALDTTPAANEQEERESPPVADGANSDVAGTASVADGTTGGSLVGYVPEAEEYPDDLDSFDELELETVGIGRDGTTAEREGGTGDAHAAQPHENGHADRPTRRTGGEPGRDETW